MSYTTSQIATYKGRKYRLLWVGQTKYGKRAHLQFFDGTRDFWVDASAVAVSDSSSRPSSGDVCAECGRGGHLVADLEDGLYKHRHCCDIEP